MELVGYRKKTWKSGHCFYAITTPIPPRHQEAEVAVPLDHAADAIREYDRMMRRHKENVPSEIRFMGCDDILLSPGNREGVKHFCFIGGYTATYIPNDGFFQNFWQNLARYGAVPHWGKLAAPNRSEAIGLYGAKFDEFASVRAELDPDAVFANEYITELFDLKHSGTAG